MWEACNSISVIFKFNRRISWLRNGFPTTPKSPTGWTQNARWPSWEERLYVCVCVSRRCRYSSRISAGEVMEGCSKTVDDAECETEEKVCDRRSSKCLLFSQWGWNEFLAWGSCQYRLVCWFNFNHALLYDNVKKWPPEHWINSTADLLWHIILSTLTAMYFSICLPCFWFCLSVPFFISRTPWGYFFLMCCTHESNWLEFGGQWSKVMVTVTSQNPFFDHKSSILTIISITFSTHLIG